MQALKLEKAPGFSPGASQTLINLRQYIRGRTIKSVAVAMAYGGQRHRDRMNCMW